MRNPWICGVFLALAGCGSGASFVKVGHFFPSNLDSLNRYRNLSSCYLLFERPPRPSGSLLESAAQKAGITTPTVEPSIAVAAEAFHRELRALGLAAIAYRKGESIEKEKPWTEKLGASSVLRIRFGPPSFSIKPFEKKVRTRSSEEKTEERRARFWRKGVGLEARLSLFSNGEARPLWETTLRVRSEKEEPARGKEAEPRGWMRRFFRSEEQRLYRKLASQWIAPIKRDWKSRRRPIFGEKKNERLEHARKAARKGKWDEALPVWKQRMESGSGDWRDLHNLGVAAESRRDYSVAKDFYKRAMQSGGDPRKGNWPEILEDLRRSATWSVASAKARDWFEHPLAVLPFSDETTSIDGPEMLRMLLVETLRNGGYNVLPTGKVDQALRREGVSQGGQLRAVPSAKWEGWLGTGRFLSAHITEFREVALGAFHRRIVAGAVEFQDLGEETKLSIEEKTLRERAHKLKEAPLAFLGQLAGGLLERIARSPLKAESRDFVERVASNLPRVPNEPRK